MGEGQLRDDGLWGDSMISNKRMAFFVMATQVNDKGEYNVLIAVEGEKGYQRTDWYWGKDFDAAERLCDERNAKMGIDRRESEKIVASTMGSPSEWRKDGN